MKQTLLGLTIMLLTSCTAMVGKEYAYVSLLGRAKDVAIDGTKATAASIDHDDANKTVQSAVKTYGSVSLAGIASNGMIKTTQAKEVTTRTGLKQNGLTERLRITETSAVEKARITASSNQF